MSVKWTNEKLAAGAASAGAKEAPTAPMAPIARNDRLVILTEVS
jgi:hypothetical protein